MDGQHEKVGERSLSVCLQGAQIKRILESQGAGEEEPGWETACSWALCAQRATGHEAMGAWAIRLPGRFRAFSTGDQRTHREMRLKGSCFPLMSQARL